MFTRKRLPPFLTSGDWTKDGPNLVKWISDYLGQLEAKNALTISQAQIYVDQGLQFPATQVASTDANNLDDYEEGAWTPVLTYATPGTSSVAYSAQSGLYVKIGRFVFAFYFVTGVVTVGTASGSLELTGLPYASSGLTAFVGAPLAWQGITKTGYTDVAAQVASGTTIVNFLASASAQNFAAVTATDTPTGGTVSLRGCVAYFTT